MGMGSDYAFNQWLRSTENYREIKPKSWQAGSGDFKWRTGDGTVLDMRTMTESHLRNAARMCEREGNTGKLKQLRSVLQGRALQPNELTHADWEIYLAGELDRVALERTGDD